MAQDVKTVLGSNFTGPQGVQGATGAGTQGATGSQGATGIQGATGAGTQGATGAQGATGTGAQGATGSAAPRTINFLISGGGTVITSGATEAAQSKGYVMMSTPVEITGWNMYANGSGSINVDIWTGTHTAFPTMVKISGGAQTPSLSSAQKNGGSNTGWTTASIAAGNVIQFRVNSAPTIDVGDVTVTLNLA